MKVPFSKQGSLKNTIATERGFTNTKGELLKSYKMTQEQIDEWNGVVVEVEEKPKTKKRKPKKKKEETVEVQEVEETKTGLLSKMFGK